MPACLATVPIRDGENCRTYLKILVMCAVPSAFERLTEFARLLSAEDSGRYKIARCNVPSSKRILPVRFRLAPKSDTDPISVRRIPLVPQPVAQPLFLIAPEQGQSRSPLHRGYRPGS